MNEPSGRIKKLAVIGDPIKHSRSPLIHNYWINQHGFSAHYEALECHPDVFESTLRGMHKQGFLGANITLPHKETALRLADVKTAKAQHIGAANTIWWQKDKLYADNTDAEGFLNNLIAAKCPLEAMQTALVWGAGGAARAVVWALCQRGFKTVLVANRTVEKAKVLCADLQLTTTTQLKPLSLEDACLQVPKAQLHINAISLGHDTTHALWSSVQWPQEAWATDLSYKPLKTPFLVRAEQAGCKTVDGLGMLLHQAVPAFERWFGVRPKVDETLRQRVEESLTQDAEQTAKIDLTGKQP